MVTRNVTIEGYLDKRLVFRQFLKGEMTEADLEALLAGSPRCFLQCRKKSAWKGRGSRSR